MCDLYFLNVAVGVVSLSQSYNIGYLQNSPIAFYSSSTSAPPKESEQNNIDTTYQQYESSSEGYVQDEQNLSISNIDQDPEESSHSSKDAVDENYVGSEVSVTEPSEKIYVSSEKPSFHYTHSDRGTTKRRYEGDVPNLQDPVFYPNEKNKIQIVFPPIFNYDEVQCKY